jgi:hypothetical protein
MHVAFKIPRVYDYISKLRKTQTEVILKHINPNVRNIGQAEAKRKKYKRLKHGGVEAYDSSAD